MFEVKIVTPQVTVVTSSGRGHTSDEWAALCVRNLIQDYKKQDEIDPVYRQFVTFRKQCEQIIAFYMELAYKSSYYKTSTYLNKSGYRHEADTIMNIHTKNLEIEGFGYLPPEDWAEICVKKLINISDTAPDFVREQANEFKDRCYVYIARYMKKAIQSSQTTMWAKLKEKDYNDVANTIASLKGNYLL